MREDEPRPREGKRLRFGRLRARCPDQRHAQFASLAGPKPDGCIGVPLTWKKFSVEKLLYRIRKIHWKPLGRKFCFGYCQFYGISIHLVEDLRGMILKARSFAQNLCNRDPLPYNRGAPT